MFTDSVFNFSDKISNVYDFSIYNITELFYGHVCPLTAQYIYMILTRICLPVPHWAYRLYVFWLYAN